MVVNIRYADHGLYESLMVDHIDGLNKWSIMANVRPPLQTMISPFRNNPQRAFTIAKPGRVHPNNWNTNNCNWLVRDQFTYFMTGYYGEISQATNPSTNVHHVCPSVRSMREPCLPNGDGPTTTHVKEVESICWVLTDGECHGNLTNQWWRFTNG